MNKLIIDDPNGILNLEFICPKCGGKMFGTSDFGTIGEIGHCHSYKNDGTKCNFTWKRPEEDEKVFHQKVKFPRILNVDDKMINPSNTKLIKRVIIEPPSSESIVLITECPVCHKTIHMYEETTFCPMCMEEIEQINIKCWEEYKKDHFDKRPFDARNVEKRIQSILDETNWDGCRNSDIQYVLEAQGRLLDSLKRLKKVK